MTKAYDIIVIGTSQGGLNALTGLLGKLPPTFSMPLVIVQHRSSDTIGALGRFLQDYSTIPVCEAEDKAPILPGRAYLAPADYHLLIDEHHFALSTEGPVHSARPSIDVLFESAADAYGAQVVGVILTGASDDGARGLAKIKRRGGYAVVQAPDTAESRLMPEAAIATGVVDQVLPLDQIAPFLVNLAHAGTGLTHGHSF